MPTRTRASFAPLLARGWLSQQAPAFQGQLLDRLSLTIFPSGATIYTPGDPPGGIYGLIRGSIGVTIAPGKAGPHLAHVAVPGSWFGEGSFLTGRPRRVGLEAATECVLAYLALADMEKLVGGDPEVMRAFAAIASVELVDGRALPALLGGSLAPAPLPVADAEVPACPACGSPMVRRQAKREGSAPFWGCSAFPRCRGTRPLGRQT